MLVYRGPIIAGRLLASAAIAAPALGQLAATGGDRSASRPSASTLPADFARFAPKTAYDMLAQVPSFTIRTRRHSERGLGQASENVLDQRPADRQQVGRRGRPAAARPRRPTSSGSRSSTRRASASPACRARSPTSSSRRPRRLGPVRMGPQLPRALRQAGVSRRVDQLFGQGRAGRLHLVGQERLRPRRPRRAGHDLRRATAC